MTTLLCHPKEEKTKHHREPHQRTAPLPIPSSKSGRRGIEPIRHLLARSRPFPEGVTEAVERCSCPTPPKVEKFFFLVMAHTLTFPVLVMPIPTFLSCRLHATVTLRASQRQAALHERRAWPRWDQNRGGRQDPNPAGGRPPPRTRVDVIAKKTYFSTSIHRGVHERIRRCTDCRPCEFLVINRGNRPRRVTTCGARGVLRSGVSVGGFCRRRAVGKVDRDGGVIRGNKKGLKMGSARVHE